MKKKILMCLAALLLFCCSACGGKESEDKTESTSADTAETASADKEDDQSGMDECLSGGILDYQKEVREADAEKAAEGGGTEETASTENAQDDADVQTSGQEEETSQNAQAAEAPVVTECKEAAWRFINEHSSASDSNESRLRKCFDYLKGYFDFQEQPMEHYDFEAVNWPYTYALESLDNSLIGDCYGFACCCGVIGSELGFPVTVITTTNDHAFAIIDDKYYGTMMGNGENGDDWHVDYNIWHQYKLH